MSHLTPTPHHRLDGHQHTIDRVVTVIAFVGPLSSLPQIFEIWFVDKSAAGVSVITWTAFVLMAVIWLLYGIVHKQRPIVISNALWIVAQSLIVIGALRFDFDWL